MQRATVIKAHQEPRWGPTGKQVYERTYSRKKSDGTNEDWYDTVVRVADGNLGLVPPEFHLPGEREKLIDYIYNFKMIPGGRHLWMSGVEGRQFLFNCYVSGWSDTLEEHFTFTFNQLMEGGGVGSNYSMNAMPRYPIFNLTTVKFLCDPDHPDYKALKDEFGSDFVIPREGKLSVLDATNIVVVGDSREGWGSALSDLLRGAGMPLPESVQHDADMARKAEVYWHDLETGEYVIPFVFDLSEVRPAGSPIKTFGGTSAGPVPLAKLLMQTSSLLGTAWQLGQLDGWVAMEIDHAIANCVVSGNVRRSARMSMMHWRDPSIEWFLHCKEDGMHHWSTNISVIVDDEFWQAVSDGDEHANHVLRKIAEGMLRNGEPGIFNMSYAQEGERGEILATNPCGEIPLEPWENCNLGHINMDAFAYDESGLEEAHELMTRFLIRATFGDITNAKTRKVVDRNRRIGVGHTGVAGYLAKSGIRYSEASHSSYPAKLTNLYSVVRGTAQKYSQELGIPEPVKVTTVAPTGTISKMPGVTEGIHPPYAKYFIRRIRYSTVDPKQVKAVKKYREQGYNVVPDVYAPYTDVVEIPTKELLVAELEGTLFEQYIESIEDIGLRDALEFQEMYQACWADNSVSYTVNVQDGWYSVQDVMDALRAYAPGLKGTTLMVDESRVLAPYQRITREVYERYKDGSIDAGYDEACASGACPVR